MYPLIFGVSAHSVFIWFAAVVLLATAVKSLPKNFGISQRCIVGLGYALFGWVGSKLLAHFELPSLAIRWTEMNGQASQGMYGGVIAFACILRLFLGPKLNHHFQWLLVSMPFAYSIARLGCLASGCCWGEVTDFPLAIQYTDSRSAMPNLYVPVHPYQLYDALASMFLGLIFLLEQKRNRKIILSRYFFFVFATRFVLEYFRAWNFDPLCFSIAPFRVLASALVAGIGALIFLYDQSGKKGIRRRLNTLALSAWKPVTSFCFLVVLSGLLTGCLGPDLPSHPDQTYIRNVDVYRQGEALFEDYALEHEVMRPYPKKNLVYVALDDLSNEKMTSKLSDFYGQKNLRVEDVSWWVHAKTAQNSYGHVVRVPPDRFNSKSLFAALNYAQALGKPFDLMLFVHGMPNYLATTPGYPFLGWEDFAKYKDWYPGLETVMLQACFGSTLANDLLALGAKRVLAFEGIHNNFFFYDVLLAVANANPELSFDLVYKATVKALPQRIRHYSLYRFILSQLGMRLENFIEDLQMPRIFKPNHGS